MKIYVVTRGEYSDYSIITATTDRDVAESIAKKFSGGYSETVVEEYEDAELMLKPCWLVTFQKDGSVAEVKNESDNYFRYHDAGRCWVPVDRRQVAVSVVADSIESAVKIAAEKRAKFLAECEGIA